MAPAGRHGQIATLIGPNGPDSLHGVRWPQRTGGELRLAALAPAGRARPPSAIGFAHVADRVGFHLSGGVARQPTVSVGLAREREPPPRRIVAGAA